uniref:Uncharacterized protein n=1 Tax=Arundo donax TaxID=35708 RepID=A0A0A9AIH9_ARUDO
MYQQTSLISK